MARRVRAHPCRGEGERRPGSPCRAGRAPHVQHLQQDRRSSTIARDRPAVSPPRTIVLGEIKVHGANIRDPVKGHGHQQLHVDVPKKFADDWWVVNAMIMFDDMTLDNGPTRVMPGSQHWAPINVPVVNQGDWEPTPLSPRRPGARPEGSRRALSRRSAGRRRRRAAAIICNSSMLAQRHAQEHRRAAPA